MAGDHACQNVHKARYALTVTTTITAFHPPGSITDPLTGIARDGARQMLAAAIKAAALIQNTVWAEACISRPLVGHADNGSPMKGATLKMTMEKPGITPSCSRPRVSNDTRSPKRCFAPASIARIGRPRALPPRPMHRPG